MDTDLDERRKRIQRDIEDFDKDFHKEPTFVDLIKFLTKAGFAIFGAIVIVLWVGGGIFNGLLHSSSSSTSETNLSVPRALCDRAEAGEPPAVVFQEPQPARVLPKLQACLDIGSYPRIENTLIPAALKLQELLNRIQKERR